MKDTQAFATKIQTERTDAIIKAPTSTTPTDATTNPPDATSQLMADLLGKALLAQNHHGLDGATGQTTATGSPTGLGYNQLFLTVFLEFYKQVVAQAETEATSENPTLPKDSILARQFAAPALNWTF